MKRPHRTAHASIWVVLAVAIPAVIVLAIVIRQDLSSAEPPERLEPPAGASQ